MKKAFAIIVLISGLSLLAQEKGTDYTLIYDSILSNSLEDLSRHLENCGDVNLVVFEGHHVFESVFVMENCEAAEMLMKAGVDLNYRNAEGKTLEQMILETGNRAMISSMLEYKGDKQL